MAAWFWCILGNRAAIPGAMQRAAGHWVEDQSLSRDSQDHSAALSQGDFILPLNFEASKGFSLKRKKN